jgi:DNA-binding CsgD family transcriptional regulator/tetratricopeptide (TPR) repeat protein
VARVQGSARARGLLDAAYIALLSCDVEAADRLAVEAIDDAGTALGLRARAIAVAALAWVLQGRMVPALQAAEMVARALAVAGPVDLAPGEPAAFTTPAHALALAFSGRLHEATEVVDAALGLPDGHGAGGRAMMASLAGRVALLRGRLGVAIEHGTGALADSETGPASQWPAAVLATAQAQIGALDAARDALDRAAATHPAIPLYTQELTLARAWCAAADGDLDAARSLAAAAASAAREAGTWTLEMMAVLDLARLGDPEAATLRLDVLCDLVDGPYVQVAAAYARSCATGDGDGLDEAAARFDAMGATLLAAEAAAGAAAAHLAAGRHDAHRTSSRRARRWAASCSGAWMPSLAGNDLGPGPAKLTSREWEVIGLAARGLTNREIADRLFVSRRTVNAHLVNAYAKLGTNDRSDLRSFLPVPRDRG